MIELSLGLSMKDGGTINAKDAIANVLMVCAKHYGGCSITEQHGAYTYEDGTVCFEHSLQIRLFSDDATVATELARKLAKEYKQESVAVTTYHTSVEFIG